MLVISTIFAPLWYPLRSHIGLLRSLCSGVQLPGTNLVLVQSTGSRFCGLEKFIMALASAWLVIRLANCNFDEAEEKMLNDDEDSISVNQNGKIEENNVNHHQQQEYKRYHVDHQQHEEEQQDDEQQEEEEEEQTEETSSESTEESTDTDILSSSDDGEIYYWRRQNGGHQPLFRFTSKELEMLLKANPNAAFANCEGNGCHQGTCGYVDDNTDHGDDAEDTNTDTEDTETDTDDGYLNSELSSHEEGNPFTPIALSQD